MSEKMRSGSGMLLNQAILSLTVPNIFKIAAFGWQALMVWARSSAVMIFSGLDIGLVKTLHHAEGIE